MSKAIENISNLSVEEQEKVLTKLATIKNLESIEVDGVVYHIPKPVSELIDNIWLQLQDKRLKLGEIQKD
jgi:hypothetical protein